MCFFLSPPVCESYFRRQPRITPCPECIMDMTSLCPIIHRVNIHKEKELRCNPQEQDLLDRIEKRKKRLLLEYEHEYGHGYKHEYDYGERNKGVANWDGTWPHGYVCRLHMYEGSI
jgi:hypothetical protein